MFKVEKLYPLFWEQSTLLSAISVFSQVDLKFSGNYTDPRSQGKPSSCKMYIQGLSLLSLVRRTWYSPFQEDSRAVFLVFSNQKGG